MTQLPSLATSNIHGGMCRLPGVPPAVLGARRGLEMSSQCGEALGRTSDSEAPDVCISSSSPEMAEPLPLELQVRAPFHSRLIRQRKSSFILRLPLSMEFLTGSSRNILPPMEIRPTHSGSPYRISSFPPEGSTTVRSTSNPGQTTGVRSTTTFPH